MANVSRRIRFLPVLCLVAVAAAQETRSSIQGLVLDPQHSAVTGATVVVTNTDTNVSNSLTTNETGYYEANFLVAGNYQVSTESPGFKKSIRSGIVLPVGRRAEINIQLELGEVAESVSVEARTLLVDTSSATISGGRVVDTRSVEELPTFNNSSMMLIKLMPGMQSGIDRSYNGTNGLGGTSSAHTMGNIGGNDWSIDGAPNMGSGYSASYLPVSLAINEFKVATSQFDASVGHTSGSIISIMTKAGTNQFHGNLLYQFWNQRWNGAPFTTKQQYYRNIAAAEAAGNSALAAKLRASPMQPSGHNQTYSATLGGPLILPKVYNGRNKLFFFFAFDGFNDRKFTRGSVNHTIPTLPQRQGDFSDLLRVNASRYQLYDPLSVRADPSRPGHFVRDTIPGNIIPRNRMINPAYNTYAKFLPNPNNLPASSSLEPLNDYVGVGEPLNWTDFAFNNRVDYQLSEKHKFFGRWTWQQLREDCCDWTYETARGLMSSGLYRNFHNGTVDWVYTPSSSTFLDTVVSGNNFAQWTSQGHSTPAALTLKYKPSDVGLPAYMDATAGAAHELPIMTFSGYETIGRPVGNYVNFETLTFKTNLTHIRGRHTLQAGFDARSHRRLGGDPGATSGSFNFTNAYTAREDDALTAGSIGHSWAAFLMGLPATATLATNATYAVSSPYYGWYVQDTWRVNSKLSLTYGFRLEVELGRRERYDRLIGGFDPRATLPITQLAQAAYAKNPVPELPASAFTVIGGSVYPGVGGTTRRVEAGEWLPAPRLGAAYQINSKTVLRGGYGISFDRRDSETVGTPDQYGFSRDTINPITQDFGQTWLSGNPAAGVSPMTDPFPVRSDGTRFDTPVAAVLGLMGRAGLGWSFVAFPNPKRARPQHWRVELERQLTTNMSVSVAYNGLYADRVNVTRKLDQLPAQYWATGLVRNNTNTTNLNQNVTNPFNIGNFSALQSSNLVLYQALASTPFFTSPTIRKSQLLRAFPQMNGLNQILNPIGETKGHSLEAVFQRRMSNGFTIHFNYVATHERDRDFFYNEFDALPSWRLSNNAAPQRISGTGIYELPFGKTKPLLHAGIGNALLGGFQIALTFEAEPGPYLTWGNVFYSGDPSNINTGVRTLDHWFNTDGFESNPARTPDAYNLRVFPSRVGGLRANGLNKWDGNIQRDFRLFEGLRFQVRVDFINLFNHTQFAAPGLNPVATDFGKVTTNSATVRRFVLFQGRFRF